jgi:hypothetical protein
MRENGDGSLQTGGALPSAIRKRNMRTAVVHFFADAHPQR